MIKALSGCVKSLIITPRQSYHILNLLQSKYEEEQIKLNPKLFHLYLDRLRTASFNERFLIVLAVDCYRTSQPVDRINQIVKFALQNLHKFQSRITIVVLLNQIHLYKFTDHKVIDQLVRKAFQIEEKQDSGYTFYNLKLLILISQLIGLDKYPQELYRKIDFKKFKPLTIVMVLELFYDKKLEKKFKITDELVDMFVACESFIPFADVHHLSYAIRKINNNKFRECFYRIRKRIQSTLNKNEEKQKFNQEGKWTTDAQLLAQFRKNIENKYKLAL